MVKRTRPRSESVWHGQKVRPVRLTAGFTNEAGDSAPLVKSNRDLEREVEELQRRLWECRRSLLVWRERAMTGWKPFTQGPDISDRDERIVLRYEELAWQFAHENNWIDDDKEPDTTARWEAWQQVAEEERMKPETVRTVLNRKRKAGFLGIKAPETRGDPKVR